MAALSWPAAQRMGRGSAAWAGGAAPGAGMRGRCGLLPRLRLAPPAWFAPVLLATCTGLVEQTDTRFLCCGPTSMLPFQAPPSPPGAIPAGRPRRHRCAGVAAWQVNRPHPCLQRAGTGGGQHGSGQLPPAMQRFHAGGACDIAAHLRPPGEGYKLSAGEAALGGAQPGLRCSVGLPASVAMTGSFAPATVHSCTSPLRRMKFPVLLANFRPLCFALHRLLHCATLGQPVCSRGWLSAASPALTAAFHHSCV